MPGPPYAHDKKYIWDWIYPRLLNKRLCDIEERFQSYFFKWSIGERRRLSSDKERSQEIPIYSGILNHYLNSLYEELNYLYNLIGSNSYTITIENISADTTLIDIVPAGYMLEYFIINEKTGNSPILNLGTTIDGSEVFWNQRLISSNLNTMVVQKLFSLTEATTLYLNDYDGMWDGSTVDIYVVLKKII